MKSWGKTGGVIGTFMHGWWGHIRWLTLAGFLALASLALTFAPSEVHAVTGAGIPCLHDDGTVPLLSSGAMQRPCDGHHCTHGPFCCCMSGCLTFAPAALPSDALLPAPFLYAAAFPVPAQTRPNGFGVRPALPPPRMIV
jgi:hypothetical protein